MSSEMRRSRRAQQVDASQQLDILPAVVDVSVAM